MTHDDLVERVARAACASVNSADTWEETGTDVHEMVWFPIARAAIAVVLEEAAMVPHRLFNADGTPPERRAAKEIAAAIRAMLPK